MLNTKSSRWSAGAAGLCVLMLVATWFLLISPRRSDAAELRDQSANRQQLNGVLQHEIDALRAQFADLPREQAVLAAIKLEMPEQRAQAALIRKLDGLAADAGVDLTDYQQGATTLAGAAPGQPQAAASSGLQVFEIPNTVTVTGDFFSMARFVKKLQTELNRAFLIKSLNVTSDLSKASGDVSVTLSGSLFVLRTASSAPIGATTPTPTPTAASPSVSPSVTPSVSPSATPTPTTTP